MDKIAQNIEYTFVNGTYQESTGNTVASKTRGLLPAITTNVLEMGTSTKPETLTYWKVAEALKCIDDQGGDTSDLVLGVSAAAMLQLNADAASNHYQSGEVLTIMGLNLQTVVTPLGRVAVVLINALNDKASVGSNTAVIFNPALMGPVYQNVPGHPLFGLEPLAKTGASERYMLYGEIGLDYGPEYWAAKITNISNDLPTTL